MSLSMSKELEGKGFEFTSHSEKKLDDVEGITVGLTFISQYAKTPGFAKVMSISDERKKLGDYLLTILKHFTTLAANKMTELGIQNDFQFKQSLYMEMIDLRVSNTAFKALAVVMELYDEFASLILSTSEIMEFLNQHWFNLKNFFFFPISLESLVSLTSTIPRVEKLLLQLPDTVKKIVQNVSSYEIKFATGFYSWYCAILINVVKSEMGRKIMLDPVDKPIYDLLSYLHVEVFPDELRIKSAEIVCMCTEDRDTQVWLLGPDVDLLPYLLLPLAGPEDFTEEENDSLPFDLQYLGSAKRREQNALIRRLILKSLVNLIRYRESRVIIREKNTYLILRELHKVEKDEVCMQLVEGIVDILIQHEEELPVTNDLGDLTIA